MKSKVKRFECPTVSIPEDMKPTTNYKRNYDQFKSKLQIQEINQKDLRLFYGEIKDYSAQHFHGKEKHQHKEDKLTKLGVAPRKQMKVPFKIKMSILQHHKQKAERERSLLKESGMVQSHSSLKVLKQTIKKKSKSDEKSTKSSKNRDRGIDFVGGNSKIPLKDGILRIPKHMLKK